MTQLTEDEARALLQNLKTLQGQKEEMLADIKVVLEAIVEIGNRFQDQSKIMGLVAKLPKMMLSKDTKVIEELIPMGAFKTFAAKYGPIVFPSEPQIEA